MLPVSNSKHLKIEVHCKNFKRRLHNSLWHVAINNSLTFFKGIPEYSLTCIHLCLYKKWCILTRFDKQERKLEIHLSLACEFQAFSCVLPTSCVRLSHYNRIGICVLLLKYKIIDEYL